jgi:copper chaperone CopZ
MYVDLLDSDNYAHINRSLIKVLGLQGAAYCSELFTIMRKAIRKNRLVDSVFVRVDRAYVEDRVGVSADDQLSIECMWEKMDLISKKSDDEFNINVGGFLGLITGQSAEKQGNAFSEEDINKLKSKLKPKTSEQKKEGKRRGIAKMLKAGLDVADEDVRAKLCDWIDIVTESGKTLSKASVGIFVDSVTKYSKGDGKVMVKVLNHAIQGYYTNASFAIAAYERSLKNKKENPTAEFRRAASRGGHTF